MKAWIQGTLAALAVVALLAPGAAWAQMKPTDRAPSSPSASAPTAGAPEKIEGEVVKIDPAQNKITVRGTDGTIHEFNASKETIGDYKVGDKIEAKLRK